MTDLPAKLEGLMRPPPDGPAPFAPPAECMECGAEPDERCASFCGNGCQTCVDEAAGFVLVPPHTCEDEW